MIKAKVAFFQPIRAFWKLQIARIGWINADPPKKPLCFDHVSILIKPVYMIASIGAGFLSRLFSSLSKSTKLKKDRLEKSLDRKPSPIEVIISLFTWSKQRWLLLRAGFFQPIRAFCIPYVLKCSDWLNKTWPSKSYSCFCSCKQATSRFTWSAQSGLACKLVNNVLPSSWMLLPDKDFQPILFNNLFFSDRYKTIRICFKQEFKPKSH